MKTFDSETIRQFSTALNGKLDRCENGEGMACANLDGSLRYCAERCAEFLSELQLWEEAVFSGRAQFDASAEQLWKDELVQLHARALRLLYKVSPATSEECFVLEGLKSLQAAAFRLQNALNNWITPKLSVAPGARIQLTEAQRKLMGERVSTLKAASSDWEPQMPQQQYAWRHMPSIGNKNIPPS